ncbi:MAG: hypothetical protein WCO45_08340 [Pseudanabaena sp. ELA607]|jgi:hypothetical protein
MVIYDTLAATVLATLTWLGLVFLSGQSPINSGRGWWQGALVMGLANGLIWLLLNALAVLGLRHVLLWGMTILIGNVLVGLLVFKPSETMQIPLWWRVAWHPLLITGMQVLLAGACGVV